MASDVKQPYSFALITAAYITVLFALLIILLEFIQDSEPVWWLVGLGVLGCYILSFLLIHFRTQLFIFKKVREIYDNVKLLEDASLTADNITTDMASLSEEVERYAKSKKIEIESLRVQEEYRRNFLGNVAHELKTPLFTVQGYILTLLDGAIKDKSVRKKYLSRAEKGVDRLIYLVNDLDMITKLEVGDLNINYEYFDLVKLIYATFEMLEMEAAKRNITLAFDDSYAKEVMVNADQERIQQLLTNLIGNSIKYGNENGTTEVSIQDLIQNKLLIRITDNGEGIEPDHLPRLFERFYRVDKSRNRRVGGSGLGLSIVKHIIEAHEEKVYVESEFGVGSEFSFTLEKAEVIE
ncbi:sensor histidine kinase [Dokdonia donghaensis]|uniref:sensor histidine kinase n=1 Tax=Dokdonia donghaensis TaxID=326320 RepID=UPI0035C850CC